MIKWMQMWNKTKRNFFFDCRLFLEDRFPLIYLMGHDESVKRFGWFFSCPPIHSSIFLCIYWQNDSFQIAQSEDIQFLHVFVPISLSSSLVVVVVPCLVRCLCISFFYFFSSISIFCMDSHSTMCCTASQLIFHLGTK